MENTLKPRRAKVDLGAIKREVPIYLLNGGLLKFNLLTLIAGFTAIAIRDSNRDKPDVVSIANGVIACVLVIPLVQNASQHD